MKGEKISWNNCFSNERYGVDSKIRGPRSDYERDWDRLIFSSAFRRLQNKTQVFPLPEEVFVHNRLTHSLEVASVGRSLGKIVGKELSDIKSIKENDDSRKFYKNHLKNVISAACLAHDMGNPAFGHSGEDAISKYFIDNENNKFLSATKEHPDRTLTELFTKQEWSDLTTFEGNANAIRVLTKNVKGRATGGYRLTYSTLGSIIKYPCESLAMASDGEKGVHRKKYGFFKLDEKVFLEITKKLNMISEKTDEGIVFKRHPFVYLVEAADDICYNIIDFEDAHRLGILSHDYVKNTFLRLVELNKKEDYNHILKMCEELDFDKNEKIAYLRAKCINYLAIRSSEVFIENKDEILSGNFDSDLLGGIAEAKEVLNEIKDKSYKTIYNYDSVVKKELAGFKIMSGIIEDLVEAALIPQKMKRHKKMLSIIPSSFVINESDTPYEKVMSIIDYVSGMTDLFALKLYKNIQGIEMPGI
jgi:dGTPase